MTRRFSATILLPVLIFTAAIWWLPSASLAGDFRKTIYQAYISGDMDSWERLLNSLQAPEMNVDDRYDFAMAHYGFIGYCMGRDEKKRARPYLAAVEVIADELLQTDPDDPRYLALRGALYGFRIGYQPQKSPFIGPKALKIVTMALEKGPDCPQAWVEAGNTDRFMPELFGGSKQEALVKYETAVRLMEKDPGLVRENWYYLHINMILAAWYEEKGRTFAAREIYRKLTGLEPHFSWAREKLK